MARKKKPTTTIKETPVNDTVDNTTLNAVETTEAGSGADTLMTSDGADSITGGDGDDTLTDDSTGGEGADTVEPEDTAPEVLAEEQDIEDVTEELPQAGQDTVVPEAPVVVAAPAVPELIIIRTLRQYGTDMAANRMITVSEGMASQRRLREGLLGAVLNDNEQIAIDSIRAAADYMAADTTGAFGETHLFRFYDMGKPALWSDVKVRKEMETILTFLLNARGNTMAMRSARLMDKESIARQCTPGNGELIVRRLSLAFGG